MIIAILTVFVVFFLFYERLPMATLILICAGVGVALFLLGRHRHTHILTIDALAQTSRLNQVNPFLKFWTILMLMMLCVSTHSPMVGIFVAVVMLLLIVFIGGLHLRDYVHLLTLPLSFLMISGLALLFEITPQCTGVLGLPLFDFWICISVESQSQTALVMARALGAVSCLYLLSLTTPLPDLIGVLRRMHCPHVAIDLMYLIYRYIFILLALHHTMKEAAASRLGFSDYRTSLHTTGNLYSNLLSRSYCQANKNFDAMESRCYDNGIRFLETKKKITLIQAIASLSITAFTLCLFLFLH